MFTWSGKSTTYQKNTGSLVYAKLSAYVEIVRWQMEGRQKPSHDETFMLFLNSTVNGKAAEDKKSNILQFAFQKASGGNVEGEFEQWEENQMTALTAWSERVRA